MNQEHSLIWVIICIVTHVIRSIYEILKQLPYDPQNQCQDNADKDHGGDGKIEPEIFLFDPDIPGQMTDPTEFVPGKIQDETGNNNNNSGYYKDLTKLRHKDVFQSQIYMKILSPDQS